MSSIKKRGENGKEKMKTGMMFVAYLIACAVITVSLSKKGMNIARACFLALGIAVGVSSVLLAVAESITTEQSIEISIALEMLLATSTIVFDVTALVICIATVILSVKAIKKIAEYIKGRGKEKKKGTEKPGEIISTKYTCLRKIFVLNCRWNK